MFILMGLITGFEYFRIKNNILYIAHKEYPDFKEITSENIGRHVGINVPSKIVKIKNTI